ncbi:nitrate reductase NapE component [Aeromicrobium panaciterrae]|uniref:Nitrate reductase NapE component n=1 Tax=Aeromicrobium panaciterrae TaxID=363861 RepID=A0ABU1URQ3_9ACTN|nr:hypothetical protein [Aeromicrobium panaciterrae]MDR7087873.1 nitrate reductase NapE component [Aeromicrobium panaciterrae]
MNTTTAPNTTATTSRLSLKSVLLLDAAVTGTNGLAYVAGFGFLDSWLGLSSTHLLLIGAFLVGCSAILATIATRRPIPRGWATFAIEVNVAWMIGSLATVAFGWLDLTTTGNIWTILQAGIVGAFAAMQLSAVRRR